MKSLFRILSISILLLLLCTNTYSYNGDLHSKISEKAYKLSNMKQYLKNNLGIKENQKFNGKTAKEWIIYGSKEEDEGRVGFWPPRVYNHFHNPVNNTGLYDIGSGISAQTWGTTAEDNKWSWNKVRGYYYQALTLPTKAERDTAYAEMFEALGHVMHLVQDMAVPAHVRNDAHAPIVGPSDPYEEWCKSNILSPGESGALDFSNIQDFKIGDFWDADVYDGSSILGMGSYKGLSEFTNANFISYDTMFTNTLPQNHKWYQPHPTLEETNYNRFTFNDNIREVQAKDGTWHRAVYLSKDVEGDTVEHFCQAGYFETVHNIVPSYRRGFEFDDRCHEDYANILLPKAVSYSAGLLNYFFRDEIQLVDTIILGLGAVKFRLLRKESNWSTNIIVFFDDESLIRAGGGYYWWYKKYGEYKYLNIESISNNEIWLTVPMPRTNPMRYIIIDNNSTLIGKVINKACIVNAKSGQIDREGHASGQGRMQDYPDKAYALFLSNPPTIFASSSLSYIHLGGWINSAVGWATATYYAWAEQRASRLYINIGNLNALQDCTINSVNLIGKIAGSAGTQTLDSEGRMESSPTTCGFSILKDTSGTWPPQWGSGSQLIYNIDVLPDFSSGDPPMAIWLDININLAPSVLNIGTDNVWEAKINIDELADHIPRLEGWDTGSFYASGSCQIETIIINYEYNEEG